MSLYSNVPGVVQTERFAVSGAGPTRLLDVTEDVTIHSVLLVNPSGGSPTVALSVKIGATTYYLTGGSAGEAVTTRLQLDFEHFLPKEHILQAGSSGLVHIHVTYSLQT